MCPRCSRTVIMSVRTSPRIFGLMMRARISPMGGCHRCVPVWCSVLQQKITLKGQAGGLCPHGLVHRWLQYRCGTANSPQQQAGGDGLPFVTKNVRLGLVNEYQQQSSAITG